MTYFFFNFSLSTLTTWRNSKPRRKWNLCCYIAAVSAEAGFLLILPNIQIVRLNLCQRLKESHPSCPKVIFSWYCRSSVIASSRFWRTSSLVTTGLCSRSHCSASKKAAFQNLRLLQIGWSFKYVDRYSLKGSQPGTWTWKISDGFR